MRDMNEAADRFITAILETDTYKEYRVALEKVKNEPGLKVQIDEFRSRNYEIQMGDECDLGKLDQLEKEFEEFREKPLVAEFLAAELAFCRMMQEVNLRITEAIHFE